MTPTRCDTSAGWASVPANCSSNPLAKREKEDEISESDRRPEPVEAAPVRHRHRTLIPRIQIARSRDIASRSIGWASEPLEGALGRRLGERALARSARARTCGPRLPCSASNRPSAKSASPKVRSLPPRRAGRPPRSRDLACSDKRPTVGQRWLPVPEVLLDEIAALCPREDRRRERPVADPNGDEWRAFWIDASAAKPTPGVVPVWSGSEPESDSPAHAQVGHFKKASGGRWYGHWRSALPAARRRRSRLRVLPDR